MASSEFEDRDTAQESVQELVHEHPHEPAPSILAESQPRDQYNSNSVQLSEETAQSDSVSGSDSRSRSQVWKKHRSRRSLSANVASMLEDRRRHHRTRAPHIHQHHSDEMDGEGEDESKLEHGDSNQSRHEREGKGESEVEVEGAQPIERFQPIETFLGPTPAPRSKKKGHGHSRSNSRQIWEGGRMDRGMNLDTDIGIGLTPIQPRHPISYSDGYASQYYRAAHRYAYGYSEGMQPIWYDQSAMAAIQPGYDPRGTPQPQPLPEGAYIPQSPLPPQPSYGWTAWMPQYSPAYPRLPPPPPQPVFDPAYPIHLPWQQTPQPDLLDMGTVPKPSQKTEDKEKRKKQFRDAVVRIEHEEGLAKEKAEAKEKRSQEKANEKAKRKTEEGKLDKGKQPDRKDEYKAFFNDVLEKSLMGDRRFTSYDSPEKTKLTPVRELRCGEISKAGPQDPTKNSIHKAYEEKLASQIKNIVGSVDINQGTSGKATNLQEESQQQKEAIQLPSHTRYVSASTSKVLKPPPGLPQPAANAMLPEPTPSEKRLEEADIWFHTDNREERYFRRTVTALANRHAIQDDKTSGLDEKNIEKQIILLVGNVIASFGAYISDRNEEHPDYFSAFRDVGHCSDGSGGGSSPERLTYFDSDPLNNNSSNIIGTSRGTQSRRAPSRAIGEKRLEVFRPRWPK